MQRISYSRVKNKLKFFFLETTKKKIEILRLTPTDNDESHLTSESARLHGYDSLEDSSLQHVSAINAVSGLDTSLKSIDSSVLLLLLIDSTP